MTPCRTDHRIPSDKSVLSKTVYFPARSVRRAKVKPSLRAGAGGVGGLVAVSIDGDFYFPGYDNNGNVIGYWNEDGEIVAEYAYDAFGNTIYEDGDMADVFPHRFSTKYYDAETDLYYYGYRYYSPSLGRWISRDPIGEEGGNNLFAFCKNEGLSTIDPIGRSGIRFFTKDESGQEKDIQTEEDIEIVYEKRSRPWGNFPMPKMDFKFSFWRHKLCEINFLVTISVMDSLKSKTEHSPGEIVGYGLHDIKKGKMTKSVSFNPVLGQVIVHEKGHAKAFFEIVKPDLEKRLAPFLGTKTKKLGLDESVLIGNLRNEYNAAYANPVFLKKSVDYSNQNSLDYYNNGPYERIKSSTSGAPADANTPDFQWRRK